MESSIHVFVCQEVTINDYKTIKKLPTDSFERIKIDSSVMLKEFRNRV